MIRIITVAIALALTAYAGGTYAQTSCNAQSTEKKLAGAAKNSFMKKCETDATAGCDNTGADVEGGIAMDGTMADTGDGLH